MTDFNYGAAIARVSNLKKHAYAVRDALTCPEHVWEQRTNPQALATDDGRIVALLARDTALCRMTAELYLPWIRGGRNSVAFRLLEQGVDHHIARRETMQLLRQLIELAAAQGAAAAPADMLALHAAIVVVSRALLIAEYRTARLYGTDGELLS